MNNVVEGKWIDYSEYLDLSKFDGRIIMVKRIKKTFFEPQLWNEYFKCWDDLDTDDFSFEAKEADKIFIVPNI